MYLLNSGTAIWAHTLRIIINRGFYNNFPFCEEMTQKNTLVSSSGGYIV